MKTFTAIALSGALVACAASAAPTAQTPKPVSFMADAKVEVDPEGKLVKVEASADLPESVRHYIEQQVAKWTFKRNVREGDTGNATSWINLGACAVPAPSGGYSMGLAFYGNGPRIAGGGRMRVTPELSAAVGRYQIEGLATVDFLVAADGTAKFSSMEGGNRMKKAVEPAIRKWIQGMRFDPEEIDGRAVATHVSVPLEFRQEAPTQETYTAQLLESPQCRQAAAAGHAADTGLRAAALDSVIAIEPAI